MNNLKKYCSIMMIGVFCLLVIDCAYCEDKVFLYDSFMPIRAGDSNARILEDTEKYMSLQLLYIHPSDMCGMDFSLIDSDNVLVSADPSATKVNKQCSRDDNKCGYAITARFNKTNPSVRYKSYTISYAGKELVRKSLPRIKVDLDGSVGGTSRSIKITNICDVPIVITGIEVGDKERIKIKKFTGEEEISVGGSYSFDVQLFSEEQNKSNNLGIAIAYEKKESSDGVLERLTNLVVLNPSIDVSDVGRFGWFWPIVGGVISTGFLGLTADYFYFGCLFGGTPVDDTTGQQENGDSSEPDAYPDFSVDYSASNRNNDSNSDSGGLRHRSIGDIDVFPIPGASGEMGTIVVGPGLLTKLAEVGSTVVDGVKSLVNTAVEWCCGGNSAEQTSMGMESVSVASVAETGEKKSLDSLLLERISTLPAVNSDNSQSLDEFVSEENPVASHSGEVPLIPVNFSVSAIPGASSVAEKPKSSGDVDETYSLSSFVNTRVPQQPTITSDQMPVTVESGIVGGMPPGSQEVDMSPRPTPSNPVAQTEKPSGIDGGRIPSHSTNDGLAARESEKSKSDSDEKPRSSGFSGTN